LIRLSNTEHQTFQTSNIKPFKLFKRGTRNTEHGTLNTERGTRNSVLSKFIQIFHFLFFQELIDATQVFPNLLIANFVNLGNKAIQKLTVV